MIALLLAALVQASPAPAPPASTIEFIRANPDRFDGRRVQVRGWLLRCRGLDCFIASRPALGAETQTLSIAYRSEAADRALHDWAPADVVVEGRFSAACLTRFICLDRAPHLSDVRLVRVLRDGLPTAQGN